jgi:hypothetical protein
MDLRSIQRPFKEKYRNDPDATAEQLDGLREKTEQYCVVMQTLAHPPLLQINWQE